MEFPRRPFFWISRLPSQRMSYHSLSTWFCVMYGPISSVPLPLWPLTLDSFSSPNPLLFLYRSPMRRLTPFFSYYAASSRRIDQAATSKYFTSMFQKGPWASFPNRWLSIFPYFYSHLALSAFHLPNFIDSHRPHLSESNMLPRASTLRLSILFALLTQRPRHLHLALNATNRLRHMA